MFRLVDSPKIYPQLSVTGLSVGPMVDTEVVMQKGGRVYLTEVEAGEIIRHFPRQIDLRAREMGWSSPDDTAAMAAEVAALQAELEQARSQQTQVIGLDEARLLLNV